MKTRVGFGFDVHRLVEGRELWLGGIRIDHTMGLLGHSDADVLIHALCDALLGAANLRDIGYHFPDTAGEYAGIDSKILLRKTVELIQGKGYTLGNADITVCAERPKLNPHIPAMQQTLADCMGCNRLWPTAWASTPTTSQLKPQLPNGWDSPAGKRASRPMPWYYSKRPDLPCNPGSSHQKKSSST